MKTVALYCISGNCRWLPYSYESVYTVVDAIYFFVSNYSYHGKPVETSALINQLLDLKDPENKKRIIQGDWKQELEQRNVTLAYAQIDGFTHALIIDADEIYDSEQLKNAFSFTESNTDIGCFHIKSLTYWKNTEWRIDPVEPHDPVIIIKIGAAGFVETRNPLAQKHLLIPPQIAICHHLSYALTDEELKQKHIFEEGHSQSCRQNWYQDIWKGWDTNPELENLHPVNPGAFKRAIKQPKSFLPQVLRSQHFE